MSSYVIGLGMGLGLAILLTSAIGLAQDRPAAQPAVQGHVDVFNSIQGRMVVMSSRSDGAPVEKGDIVCELDPRELKDRLATQDIVVRAAEFDLESAAMAREATGMRIVEYVEGQLKNVLATIAGEIKVAEANLSIAEDQLDWARRMFDKGYVSLAEKVTNELQLKEARFGLEATQSRKKVLLDYTKERTLKQLRSEAAAAMARELAVQAALEREAFGPEKPDGPDRSLQNRGPVWRPRRVYRPDRRRGGCARRAVALSGCSGRNGDYEGEMRDPSLIGGIRVRIISINIVCCAVCVLATGSSAEGLQPPPPGDGAEINQLLAPYFPPSLDFDKEIAGLSKGSRPEILTWERIYALALVRARSVRGAFAPMLNPIALNQEAARHGVADFARFREEFLTGRVPAGGAFRDPSAQVFGLLGRLHTIDNARRVVALHDNLHRMLQERSQSESSGVNRLDVELVDASKVRAQQDLAVEIRQFRDGLDAAQIHARPFPSCGAAPGPSEPRSVPRRARIHRKLDENSEARPPDLAQAGRALAGSGRGRSRPSAALRPGRDEPGSMGRNPEPRRGTRGQESKGARQGFGFRQHWRPARASGSASHPQPVRRAASL